MADVLSVPAEFDQILVGQIAAGMDAAYGENRPVPRPPLGAFTHHAVQTFAKTCGEGQIGINWRDNLKIAREAWKSLSPEELSLVQQAADRDKQSYDERVQLAGPAGTAGAVELLHLLEEDKLQKSGVALSAFDLFRSSPEVRSRIYDVREGPVDYCEFYGDKVVLWLWARIDDEEKSHWREAAVKRLESRNNARSKEGKEALVLDKGPDCPEEASPLKRKRHGPPKILRKNLGPPKYLESPEAPKDDDDEEEKDDHDEDEDEEMSESTDEKPDVSMREALRWNPTDDEKLTAEERKILESIRPDLHRWDRPPRVARSAYTFYYADRLTTPGSPHIVKDPHCSTTRAEIHADWKAAGEETHKHFEICAEADEVEVKRQSKEYWDWVSEWRSLEDRMLLRKVIDRWQPHSSFDDGQNRIPAAIPRRPLPTHRPAVEFGLPCVHYPVIRTDYTNGAVYEKVRHILLNSNFLDQSLTFMEMTFYDGLESPSTLLSSVPDHAWPSIHPEDPRATDYEWCKNTLENMSVDDLKASFGELEFHRKEHVPIYNLGGRGYAIIVDSQSMKDGTVKFVSMSIYDFTDIRPDPPGPKGAWEQDPKKEWYLAPRLPAADVIIQLVNLDIANTSWNENVKHRTDHGLDLLSDPNAHQWRGWQWAIEYIFGEQALENVVGSYETLPGFPDEDEEEEEEEEEKS